MNTVNQMSFEDTVKLAIEIYNEQPAGKKDLLKAAMQANEQAGDEWNTRGVQTAAYKIIYA